MRTPASVPLPQESAQAGASTTPVAGRGVAAVADVYSGAVQAIIVAAAHRFVQVV